MNFSAIPVLYYHSIKYKIKNNWLHPYDILKLDDFYRHLKFFNSLKLNTYFIDNVYEHLCGKKSLPLNTIILTFDDGYLDNLTFVFPLLKKYKLKATIWVVPDFVDNNDTKIRPTIEDYWNNKITLEELNNIDGYLNWEEMRLMEKSGYVDIQSHTLTHAKYPISDKIIDFVNPDTKIDWLYWNLYPEDKPNFISNPSHKIPLGFPIYESQKGNIAIKYEEKGNLTKKIVEFVREKGEKDFFNNPNWRNILFDLAYRLKNKNDISYQKETREQYIKRIRSELSKSKNIIEENLQKKVNHVCWPFGAWNETTENLARDCGYKTSTIRGEKNVFNKPEYRRVDRIALDNPKYQNKLFYFYSSYKLLTYKLLK